MIENKRINGKVKQIRQICVGSPEKVYEMLNADAEVIVASYPFGKAAALMKMAEKLDLISCVDKHVPRRKQEGLSPGEYLLLLIVGRSEHALSRNQMSEWFGRSSMQFFYSPKHKLNSQNLLNYMKRFDEVSIPLIESDISKRLIELGHFPKHLIIDTTNQHTYINNGETLPKKGNSKKKRNDKNLVGVGLVTSDINIPLLSEVYSGNETDVKIFVPIIEALCKRIEVMKVDSKDLILIFDRGFNSEDNINLIVGKMKMIGGLKRNQVSDLMGIAKNEYTLLYLNEKEHKIFGLDCGKRNVLGKEFRIMLTYNEHTEYNQKKQYDKTKQEVLALVDELRSKANRKGKGRKPSVKGITLRLVDKIPKQYRSIFDFNVQLVDGDIHIDFSIDLVRERELFDSFGKQALFTDLDEWTLADIVKTYHSRNLIENDFKILNDKLIMPLAPVNVRKDISIRAHVFVCIMGLVLYRLMVQELKMDISLQRLMQLLDNIRIAVVGKEHEKPTIVVEKMDKETAKIFSRLGLAEFVP